MNGKERNPLLCVLQNVNFFPRFMELRAPLKYSDCENILKRSDARVVALEKNDVSLIDDGNFFSREQIQEIFKIFGWDFFVAALVELTD